MTAAAAGSRELLSAVEAALLSPAPPSPAQRVELIHALRAAPPAFRTLLSYPGPNGTDREQVRRKEVRLPELAAPVSLDDTDVAVALKLSDELNLNEIECIRLLIAANKEWSLYGRELLEIYQLAAGLWYMERRDLITSLFILLRSVILDWEMDADLVSDIHKYLEDLFVDGLRERLINLIKELKREEPSGIGSLNSERHVLDPRGALAERRATVSRERLTLTHCLVLSVLTARIAPKEFKDIVVILKDGAAGAVDESCIVERQITNGLLFSIVIAFVSEALNASANRSSFVSLEGSFRKEFHDLVMSSCNDPNILGYIVIVRFAWSIHLMLTQDHTSMDVSSSRYLEYIYACFESIISENVFQFLLEKVIRTAAFENDDEDIKRMYIGYLHKLMMCFLSHPLSRSKVKELKEKAMHTLSPYNFPGHRDFREELMTSRRQSGGISNQPFVSLLELTGEIYEKDPELLQGNEELWSFVADAGEDHTNTQTLVAYLKLLSSLASNEEGASKVFELLQGKIFRSIGWSTLFECLSIYEEKFKQSFQSPGNILTEFPEGDAQAVVAYLNILQKVIENGNPIERRKWFPDIEPLFKLLSYQNVPPYLKGALRNSISVFIKVSPVLKDIIWSYLEQYDLPVVSSVTGSGSQHSSLTTQSYDMRFELNEVEARNESYPSTLSFIKLVNALISEERDVSDRGRRFWGIFRFVYHQVFGPFPQRAYSDPCEKWQLIIACLEHFRLILRLYDVGEMDIHGAVEIASSSPMQRPSEFGTEFPVLELLKDFMSAQLAFRNTLSIVLLGVNTLITERTTQIYGYLLEKAVNLALEIIILVLERDIILGDHLRPFYQPLDVILERDHREIVALLEYVRYDYLPEIQKCAIKIMSVLSSRMAGLVQLLLKGDRANSLIEDYATCLELRFDDLQTIDNTKDDIGVMILQLLLDNVSQPAPSVTHLLLGFDVHNAVERTILKPKVHYSCLRVILGNLEKLSNPNTNAILHEFSLQLLYELCLDPSSCQPVVNLLITKKYQFFVKHLGSIAVDPLPKRNNCQALRISSLHLRAWLLKLLALELHIADLSVSAHQETWVSIISALFQSLDESRSTTVLQSLQSFPNNTAAQSISKSKALELLEVVEFKPPETSTGLPQLQSVSKFESMVGDILKTSEKPGFGGVYYYSERGDRLIDLDSFHNKILQMSNDVSEVDKTQLKEVAHHLIKWGWKYNHNLEELAAQLHMLTGWSQIVEVAVSRRMSFIEDRTEVLYELLDGSLSATASPDCSLKMALMLTNVAVTLMAKLWDERFICPGVDSDTITYLNIISSKQLPNAACHALLFKLVMSILRTESSESLRRRQYALLLSYFKYCQSALEPDIPPSILRLLIGEEQDGDDELNLQKIVKDQNELAYSNFSIIRKEAQATIDVIAKDAVQASEAGKACSFYVFDLLVSIDHEKFFLNQLQSRGILRACLNDISNFSFEDARVSVGLSQRLCTLEAQLYLLLRISHCYGKHGAQVLLSMGTLEVLSSCRFIWQSKGNSKRTLLNVGKGQARGLDIHRFLIVPVLRLVFSLTSLVGSSDYLEVNNRTVREVKGFLKGHQLMISHILREDLSRADKASLEQINLVVSILSKVWAYDEDDEYGFIQDLYSMMHFVFLLDKGFLSSMQSADTFNKSELPFFCLCLSLSSYLYFLVRKKNMRFEVSTAFDHPDSASQKQPSLEMLANLLDSVRAVMERVGEEKFLLVAKIEDINELSRQEVDDILKSCMKREIVSPNDNIRKRRYVAMMEMGRLAGSRDELIGVLLQVAECTVNTLLLHFQDESDGEDLTLLCEKLLPILERLENLKEDKIGRSIKVFHRSVSTLKELTIKRLAI